MLWYQYVNCLISLLLVQEVNHKDDFDLLEWRIRAEQDQDQAYQESLKADIAKVSYLLVAECTPLECTLSQ